MKKIEYLAPEMEIVELKNKVAILAGSGEEPEWKDEPGESED